MAAITFADDLVRDYLLFRGFVNALKAFDTEIKTDKDKGFRVSNVFTLNARNFSLPWF